MLVRKSCLCFFAALLATSVLTTGCQPAQNSSQPVQPVAQPAPNETVIYNKWEVETHRDHKEINQRTADEQKEYRDWRGKHPDNH
jgi:Spy/CpxP family protein refolding chaperone